ncbi:hypothetical protein UA08_09515 [Talaromyces atroroseus]|uniref:Short-chain dehydrogenase/reductase 3 n=1 Tax=Talaromyces atroroseus TaxID=1441469 RepID=A0A1Q5Q5W9_TALAT|nr:hypothetical protein UA08_09515 [Talaromyces atroroseus]OKL55217.1 hypothetical protein UA08_09515 [Talaromyces atroroseus]
MQACIYSTAPVQRPNIQRLTLNVESILLSSTTRNLLAVVIALKLLAKLNRVLSTLALNNWMSDKYDWSHEIVLLTGGCSGIGQGVVARGLARRGVKVIVVDIQEPSSPLPKNVYFYKCDVTSTSSIRQAGAQIRADHGDPTILINNAGVGQEGSILDKPESVIRLTFEVNTLAHWWTVREFLPAMLKQNHGHIITIASTCSFLGPSEMSDYAFSKASAMSFHEGLTQEIRLLHKTKKVCTSIVYPMWVRTPLVKSVTDCRVKVRQPVLEVEDVAKVIVKHVLGGHSGQVNIPDWVGAGS